MPMTTPPHWKLGQLYEPDSPALAAAITEMQERGRAFAAHRATVEAGGLSPDAFAALTAEMEALSRLTHRLSGFAGLWFSQNTQDQKAQAFMARMDELTAELGNDLLFFEIWWKDLPEAEAAPFLAAAPDFHYWLTRLRAYKPHTLAESQERIVNLKNITGAEALVALYDSITGRYTFPVDFVPGEPARQASRDELMVYARHADPAVRAAAYQRLYQVYGDDGPILGRLYQTRVRDWRIENLKLRAYASPAEVRHKANDLSPATVESLLAVCRDQAPLFRKFFKIKAGVLRLPAFRRYDLYAPLSGAEPRWAFDQAREEVLAAFGGFSPEFKKLAGNILEAGRFSAEARAGKQGGAFCASLTPGEAPWVLMTYSGRRNDLFTMAHELGHGIHSQLAAGHNLFHFHATLPLAETASTFGEMLLARRLLDQAGDPAARADLLFHLLDDAYATVGRQAFFALFEIKAHEMVEAGATVSELAEAYYGDLREQFGPEMEVADEFRWEWVSIPHFFHTPFYVYAYSFGQLLVYSLWRQYEREGAGFAARLTALLARGGSAAPEEILRQAGLPPLDEQFWRGGFDVIGDFITRLTDELSR